MTNRRLKTAIEEVLKLWRLSRIGVIRPADFKMISDTFEELKEAAKEENRK